MAWVFTKVCFWKKHSENFWNLLCITMAPAQLCRWGAMTAAFLYKPPGILSPSLTCQGKSKKPGKSPSNSNRMEIAFSVKLSKGNLLHLLKHIWHWTVLLCVFSDKNDDFIFTHITSHHERACMWRVTHRVSTRGLYKPSMPCLERSLILLSKLAQTPLYNRLPHCVDMWNTFLDMVYAEC